MTISAADRPLEQSPPGSSTGIVSLSSVERAWLVVTTLVLYVLFVLPATMAQLAGPVDRVHVGTYWFAGDFGVYAAAMREGMTSPSWLIHNHATAELHNPVLIFPLYVAIGKVAAATGLPIMVLYALVEGLGRLLLLVSVYVFVARFITRPGLRRLAFALAILTAGVRPWLAIVQKLSGVPDEQVNAINPGVEIMPFGTFWAAPHIAIGVATTLLALPFASAAAAGNRRALLALAVDVMVLGLVHPFNLPVLLAALGVYALLRLIEAPVPGIVARIRAAAMPILVAGVAAVAGSPLVIYNALTFASDPFWSTSYGAQNTMFSPAPILLPIDCGIVVLLAPVGLFALWRARRTTPTSSDAANMNDIALLIVFVAVIVAFMYIPVPYQRRFAVGFIPALAVFAALGWPLVQSGALRLAGRLSASEAGQRRAARRLTAYPLIFVGFTTTFFIYLSVVLSAMNNAPIAVYFVDRDTYELGEQLAARTGTDDVVLAAYDTANVFMGLLPGRVVAGNAGVTPNLRPKLDKIEAMYRGELSAEETRDFLRANRVTYIVVGGEERKIGSNDPGVQLGLPPTLRQGASVAYRVTS